MLAEDRGGAEPDAIDVITKPIGSAGEGRLSLASRADGRQLSRLIGRPTTPLAEVVAAALAR